MSDPDREHLLGYLLGALDLDEHRRIEQAIETRPELREPLERLRTRVGVLACDAEVYSPPHGLAQRTCAQLTHWIERPAEQPVAPSNTGHGGLSPTPLRERWLAPRWQSWSLADVVVSGGIALVVAMLFFPAIVHSRFRAQILTCQNNIRQIGNALFSFAQDHGGLFPQESEYGPRAFAGIFGPTLHEGGYFTDPRILLCPTAPPGDNRQDWELPALLQIDQADERDRYLLHAAASGDLAFNLGYYDGNKYVGPRDTHRATNAILSDVPSWNAKGLIGSRNHDGRGHNVLKGDGSMLFTTSPTIAGHDDNLFLNNRGEIGAGLHELDVVLAPGWASPRPGTGKPPSPTTTAPQRVRRP